MENKMISANDLKSYFGHSKKIAELEATLYETGNKLSQEESKIENVVSAQNKIRFDDNGNDLFRDQVENVIQTLAANYKVYGFDKELYFDLVYNLLMQEYERVEKLIKEDGVSNMLQDLKITDHLKEKIKALLDHEKEGCGSCH
jgi:hypothetical protein